MLQGLLDVSLHRDEPKLLTTGADFCALVEYMLDWFTDQELDFQKMSQLLGQPAFAWALTLGLSQCTQHFNQAIRDFNLPGTYGGQILMHLASGAPRIPTVRILEMGDHSLARRFELRRRLHELIEPKQQQVVHPAKEEESGQEAVESQDSQHNRKLLARASTRMKSGQSSGATDALQYAKVSSQNRTTEDLPISSEPIGGTVLRPRELGRGNAIVGGILLTQWRVDADQRHERICKARFAHLDGHCVHTPQVYADDHAHEDESTKYSTLQDKSDPFGKDPAYNPTSSLFSTEAASLEDRFYNRSRGSDEVSDLGFPLAFLPRNGAGKGKRFVIVFPVRFMPLLCCTAHRMQTAG